MWILIIIGIVVWVVIANAGSSNSTQTSAPRQGTSSTKRPPPVPSGSVPTRFEVRVKKGIKDLGEVTADVINIAIRGPVSAPTNNCPTRICCELLDVTTSKPMPVIVTIGDLQAPDSPFFYYETEGPDLPYCESVIQKWMELFSFPSEFFVYPHKGQRKLQVKVSVVHGTSNLVFASGTTTIGVLSEEKGYLEAHEERKKVREITLQLAMAVSAADGHLASEESNFIKKWVKERTKTADGGRDEDEVEALNRVIRKAYDELTRGEGIKLHPLCESLVALASKAERYDALELCVRLAGADGVAEAEEMDVLHSIATWLDVRQEKLRSFVDKHLPVTMHPTPNVSQVLGIDDHMGEHEKKKALRKAFKHWNAMIAHSDPAKRQQAQDMLDLIARERAKLS